MIQSEELLWAWAAGIMDGEGSFILSKIRDRGSFTVAVHVEMAHRETIDKLRRIFRSGQTYERKRAPKWNTMTRLQINSKEAVDLIKRLLPYLVTKREQALLLIEYGEKCLTERGHNKPISNDIRNLREIIFDELRKLNKRGDNDTES